MHDGIGRRDRSPVLVTSDLSRLSDVAIVVGHERALAEERPLVVLHVIPRHLKAEFLLPGMEPAERPPVLRSTARVRLRQRVRRLTGRSESEYLVRVERGDPYRRILLAARSCDASMIVVGAHPRERHDHPILGSVTERVVRHAARPVLVARGSNGNGPILAATDLADRELPAVDAAADEARRRAVPLFVIHSLELSLLGGTARVDGAEAAVPARLYLRLLGEAESRMARIRERVGISGESLVPVGPAADAILGAAERLRPSLIVVGSRHKKGWRRALLGSVAEDVARRASASVLVVPLKSRVRLRAAAARS
jgi:nucleotide-binding universal stress UspA family protein